MVPGRTAWYAPKIKLGYWNLRGYGQVSRYLLEYTGAIYEEKRYTEVEEEAWGNQFSQELVKKGLFWYNLPYVEEGDLLLSESKAVEEYIIKRSPLS